MTRTTETSEKPVLVLFRQDLRIADNRALHAATASGKPVVAAFISDEKSPGIRPLGGAARWWLHHSLAALTEAIEARGGSLILRSGEMSRVVLHLIEETGTDLVLWNRRYDPPATEADRKMKAALKERGTGAESFDGQLLHEPWQLKTKTGGPYKVYSAFWRALTAQAEPRAPAPAPRRLEAARSQPASERLADWKLLPRGPDWSGGLAAEWQPGEAGARARLKSFLDEALAGYREGRERPDREGTSRLSPHLAHGEITPFQIWHALASGHGRAGAGPETFRKELVWREFCWHLLFHNPGLATRNYNPRFDGFPWAGGQKLLHAWQRGLTGYPIVDAGMRQLWQTGWMHNRVRMVAASFLTKHCLIDWRDGEKWFWDTLVDADPASNPGNWQWVAGSGADAAPYFRVFNPVLQGEKFDPKGDYVRRYVPELAGLPPKLVHQPWEASKSTLSAAGVKLGETYPVPVVEHASARERALDAYRAGRGEG